MSEIKDRIREAMTICDVTSSKLAKQTGLAASSISQYLSGKTVPSGRALRKMADALHVSVGYLEGKEDHIVLRTSKKAGKILTCEDVARLMHKSQDFVRKGLQEGVFPFGYAVKTSSKWSYFISAEKFTEATGIEV